ncbi:MAG: hypothetical protein KTR28_08020 [Micavibrio sp.]|nr:hypothetical protein [Micavibrio sp.]
MAPYKLGLAFEPTKEGYLKFKASDNLSRAGYAGDMITTMIERAKLQGRSHEVRHRLYDFFTNVSQMHGASFDDLNTAFEKGQIFIDQPKFIWAWNVQNILNGKNEYLIDQSTVPTPGKMN